MLGENEKQEIIIVRRSSGGEEGHHGGAWKIAFADFMTAMMALFLVLWLVNATDEEAQKSIASYFNPVKLVDRKKSEKGLEPAQNSPDAPTQEFESNGDSDAKFFGNPGAMLDEIVNADAIGAPLDQQMGDGIGSPSELDNDNVAEPLFVDPFSQTYWEDKGVETSEPDAEKVTSLREQIQQQLEDSGSEPGPETVAVDAPIVTEDGGGAEASAAIEPQPEELETTEPAAEITDETGEAVDEDVAAAPVPEPVEPEAVAAEELEPEKTEAEELAESVEKTLEDVLSVIGLNSEQVSVVPHNESVLVSLSDNLNFSMFGVGSAVPKAELINAVDAIGAQIADRDVSLSVIGHTDGRAYRGETYDNWRLSAARAQATVYMLVRSGIDEQRITSVVGKADRELKNAEDAFAPENRRIEILIELDSQ